MKKVFFFLSGSGGLTPPPPLSGVTTKKTLIFLYVFPNNEMDIFVVLLRETVKKITYLADMSANKAFSPPQDLKDTWEQFFFFFITLI